MQAEADAANPHFLDVSDVKMAPDGDADVPEADTIQCASLSPLRWPLNLTSFFARAFSASTDDAMMLLAS